MSTQTNTEMNTAINSNVEAKSKDAPLNTEADVENAADRVVEDSNELSADEQADIAKKEQMQQRSLHIKEMADNEENSALKCIHQISVAGGATRGTYTAIERRVIKDQDTYGAYHLALLSQSTPDLPIDARQLIEMVTNYGDNDQLLSLLRNLPIPPVDAIKQRILDSEDGEAIGKMNAYLQSNPDGYGSQVTLASGQKDRIIPLSEG